MLVPALWFVVLSALLGFDDWGRLEPAPSLMVPDDAEPPAPLTVKCSRTLFTPGTLFAMSFALLRSAFDGTEPLKVARPFETLTSTLAKSGFDASWSLICLVS